MSFYSRLVLPRLIDFAMKCGDIEELRREIIPEARGCVLEIGAGSGMNFSFYGSGVSRLVAVDSSRELVDMARDKRTSALFQIALIVGSADRLPIRAKSIDTVVVTFALCSIAQPLVALEEARRVLKSGGCLLFAEHGLSPDATIRTWQNRLTPIWRRFAGGCHLNRKMDDLIQSAGFSISSLSTRYIAGPRVATYTYTGTAVPEKRAG